MTFLSELRPQIGQLRTLARKDVVAFDAPQVPAHLILHSGLAGSTLLARALYQPATVVTFKEPPIHTDVIAYGLNGATQQEVAQLNEEVTSLLARGQGFARQIVIKMNSIGNSFVAPIARKRASSQILCLHSPLERFLLSLAAKGGEGLMGGRKLFTGMRNSGLANWILPDEGATYSDLQLASAAWLAIRRLMHEATAEFGPERVRSLASERLFSDPAATLSAIARHFMLDLDVQARLGSGVFTHHSKTGLPFNNAQRNQQDAAVMAAHGREIGLTVDWAHRVSEMAKIPWEVANPLLL